MGAERKRHDCRFLCDNKIRKIGGFEENMEIELDHRDGLYTASDNHSESLDSY
jgi:hypothetical protein